MDNKPTVSEEVKPEPEQRKVISRRDMVRRLATAMSAGGALSAIPSAAAEPAYKHVAGEAASAPTGFKASNATWTPAFFDPHQSETFAVLAERIVPGSGEAQVSHFVDLLLSVDTQQDQKEFLNSLSAFEAYSLKAYQRPFKDLSEEQQNQVLTVASTGEPGEELRRQRRRHILRPASSGVSEESVFTFRDHFENLKRWVSDAYFSSEPGMKYLGWTGQVYFSSFPGCKGPGSHA
jgi:Gluconate 2-dehydrogenase subunit 3